MSSQRKDTIDEWMTVFPVFVEPSHSLKTALQMMHRYDIRHLPVMEAGKVLGVIYEREVVALSGHRTVDPEQETIREIVRKVPLEAAADKTVREVIEVMQLKREDCVFVFRSGKLTGIFTLVDAIRYFLS